MLLSSTMGKQNQFDSYSIFLEIRWLLVAAKLGSVIAGNLSQVCHIHSGWLVKGLLFISKKGEGGQNCEGSWKLLLEAF